MICLVIMMDVVTHASHVMQLSFFDSSHISFSIPKYRIPYLAS